MATQQTSAPEVATADPTVDTYIEPTGWGKGRYWALYIQCPHCGDRHHHGGGLVSDGPPDLGNRAAHCLTGPMRGYTLVAGPPDMEKPAAFTYRQRQRLLYEDDRRRGFAYRETVVGR